MFYQNTGLWKCCTFYFQNWKFVAKVIDLRTWRTLIKIILYRNKPLSYSSFRSLRVKVSLKIKHHPTWNWSEGPKSFFFSMPKPVNQTYHSCSSSSSNSSSSSATVVMMQGGFRKWLPGGNGLSGKVCEETGEKVGYSWAFGWCPNSIADRSGDRVMCKWVIRLGALTARKLGPVNDVGVIWKRGQKG